MRHVEYYPDENREQPPRAPAQSFGNWPSFNPYPPPLPLADELLETALPHPRIVTLYGGGGSLVRAVMNRLLKAAVLDATPGQSYLFIDHPTTIDLVDAEVDRRDPRLVVVVDFPACALMELGNQHPANAVYRATERVRRWKEADRAVVLGSVAPKPWRPEQFVAGDWESWLSEPARYLSEFADEAFVTIPLPYGARLYHVGARHRVKQPHVDLLLDLTP